MEIKLTLDNDQFLDHMVYHVTCPGYHGNGTVYTPVQGYRSNLLYNWNNLLLSNTNKNYDAKIALIIFSIHSTESTKEHRSVL